MTRLIIGAAVRTVGAHPAGWRQPGAHRDPRADATALRRIARTAEAARVDFLAFGERRAPGAGAGYRDPHLVARVEPLTAVCHLAAVTERIGLVAAADTSTADPVLLARQTASADLLSSGRAGVELVDCPPPGTAPGSDPDQDVRAERVAEFEAALRLLWDSVDDDALVADADAGEFVDADAVRSPGFHGRHVAVDRPLDVPRPVQGHLPVFHSAATPQARLFAALNADVAIVPARGLAHAAALREELRALAFESGRDDRTLRVLAPVLPIVGETPEHARRLADDLSRGVLVVEDWADAPPAGFPAHRSLRALSRLVGLDLAGRSPDDPVSRELAVRFTTAGQELVERVARHTGRLPEGEEPVTFRHLVAAASVVTWTVVGTAAEVAAEFATWADAGAVDGFTVLSATQPAQFEAFALGVVPELRRLGVMPDAYEGETLRDHLGLGRPENAHRAAFDPRFPPVYRPFDRAVASR